MIASTSMSPARPDRWIMATVFLCSIFAGWAMLPGDNERVAMLERDGHSREALDILEHQVTGGDKRYRTLHQILALYENEGNVGKARSVLEAMTADHPRDVTVKRRLTQFYRSNHLQAEYIATLQDMIEIRYSEATCRELIAVLRFAGNAGVEQAALQRCRQKGYRRADDLSRLAELVAADGDNAQATGILKSIDDLRRLKTVRERFQLLSLLAEQDQPNEAERRALRWIRSTHDDATAVSLIDHLARGKHPDSAYEVAKDAGIPGDGISLTVAERLIEKSQGGAALLYLRGWLDRATAADAETAIRFVDSALAVGDPRLAIQGARRFGYVLLPKHSLSKLAGALEQMDARLEAAEVRTALSGGGPVAPEAGAKDAAKLDTSPDTDSALDAGDAGASAGERVRSVLLVDPLDAWKRSLFTNMSTDAKRRAEAMFVGPRPPALHAARHFDSHARSRDVRPDHLASGSRLLKKTSRVLQRTKKISALRAKRSLAQQNKPKAGFGDSQQQTTPPGKFKANGAQKP